MIRAALFLGLILATPSVAAAQIAFESVGTRALGMAGAFVGVADDATAVHWNPAGLPGAGPFGLTIGWHRFQNGNQDQIPAPGPSRGAASLTSVGTMPLGLSFGRFRIARLEAALGGGSRAVALSTSQFGVTLVQTVVPGLIVGSTLKFVRGTATSGPIEGATAESALEGALDRGGPGDGAFDMDVGVMADLTYVRLGLTTKNLLQPRFKGIGDFAMRLERRTRIGLAVLPASGVTLAIDLDLDTADPQGGLRRMIALGAETRLGARAAVRGGVRWNRDGVRQAIGAVGASVEVRRRFWLDGYYSHGRAGEDRGFGIALRAGY